MLINSLVQYRPLHDNNSERASTKINNTLCCLFLLKACTVMPLANIYTNMFMKLKKRFDLNQDYKRTQP